MGATEPSKEAYLAEFAKDLKTQIDTPVMLCGGIRSMDVIERLYEEKATDYFSMSRPLISEPDLINKFQSGATRKARCISVHEANIVVSISPLGKFDHSVR